MHAWCAAERRPIPITFGSSSLVRWAAGSATSSRCHCVASTTASFTARVTRLHGGVSSPSILFRWRSSYGSTLGSMAWPFRPVVAPSLGLRPRRTSPSRTKPARAFIQASMQGAPPPKIPTAPQANDLVSTDQPKVKRALHKVMMPNQAAARSAARRFADRFEECYPAAVACLRNDLDELLICFHYKSEDQRRRVRTTNAIERRFREVRRRTRPMGTFQDKTSMDRILFAVFTHENKSQRGCRFRHLAAPSRSAGPLMSIT